MDGFKIDSEDTTLTPIELFSPLVQYRRKWDQSDNTKH